MHPPLLPACMDFSSNEQCPTIDSFTEARLAFNWLSPFYSVVLTGCHSLDKCWEVGYFLSNHPKPVAFWRMRVTDNGFCAVGQGIGCSERNSVTQEKKLTTTVTYTRSSSLRPLLFSILFYLSSPVILKKAWKFETCNQAIRCPRSYL